jgi:hypothetical protein
MPSDEPPRRPPGSRQGSPGASSRWRSPSPQQGSFLGNEAPSPYRPYSSYTGITRMRMPDVAQAQAMVTSARMQAVHQHHGFAIFHDGNAGHLWRAEVASSFGEAILSAGAVMWLAYLTDSVFAVALGVVALGLPWLLAGPLGTRLRNVEEPGGRLAWIGRLRILFVLGLIPMHFVTIYPAVFGLLFAISFCGRLREHLRIAATRTCLAPGELERVSNDLHVGAALAAVAGPLLATLFFALVGERILVVSAVVAVCFLLGMNSDNFLDALPKSQRAFLLAAPEATDPHEAWETGDVAGFADDEGMDSQMRRELRVAEWYQQGPEKAWQAIAELRAGLGLAGGRKSSRWSLIALGTLALVGGGLAVLEVFLLGERLSLPSLYLGPLLAAEGAGLALGALAGGAEARGNGRGAWLFGMMGTGLMLMLLAVSPLVPLTLAVALLMGVMNAVAVSGARRVLQRGFTGIERRALAAAESWLTALCGVAGALFFALFYGGTTGLGPLSALPLKGWSLGVLLPGAGASLILAGIVFGLMGGGSDSEDEDDIESEEPAASTRRGRVPQGDAADDGGSAYMPAMGRGGWDDEAGYTDERYAASRNGPAADYYGEDDDPEDPRTRRSGLAPRRPPSGGGGGRSLRRW